jgi:transposase-like protein
MHKGLFRPFKQRSTAVKCHVARARAFMSASANGGVGADMKCLACGAEMRLTDVGPDRTTGIERHTFRCSACAHTAQRLMLNRARVPITNLPVVIPRKVPVIDPHNGRPAAQSAWAKSIEKVNNKQADLKQRAAATTDWGSVVEKLSTALKQQAGAARAEALARAVEKMRGRQTGLPVRMADSEFDRVWYGHCPDEAPSPSLRDLS